MEGILEFLEQCFHIFLFCLGITVLLGNAGSMERLLAEAGENVNASPVFYMQGQEAGEHIISYGTLMSMLMQEISIDVEVNGLLIPAEGFDPVTFTYPHIADTDYLEEYVYNPDGTVKKITYQSKRS